MRTVAIIIALLVACASAMAETGGPPGVLPKPAAGRVPLVPIPSAPGQLPPPAAATGASPQFLNNTEAAIDQQTRGDFPVMDRSPSLPLGTLQRSWDRPKPATGQTAPGIIHYMWHADFIMSLRTRDFMVTTLFLPSWERVNEFYLGDPVVFEAKRVRPNVIAVRSRNAGADSNLTVLGASGNVYNFYLRSETWNSSQVSDLTVYVDAPRNEAQGPVPAAEGGGEETAAPGDFLRQVAFRPENLRFDMKMYARRKEDAAIAPQRVYEDGVFTYFDFGEQSDSVARPVVHQLVDGVDTVVNTRTAGPRGNILIAEAVGDFTLRNGGRVVCVRRLGKEAETQAIGEMP
ncbi:MAG TPA: TrbG/VirB9 family P-type conjugative transfer protein [Rhodospirillaceae bacterium]|nr:TrbG/VirB9 family P-type conjugative transfer protein [Rhodospirillaceae bacterium]